jgi:hypothetical protein
MERRTGSGEAHLVDIDCRVQMAADGPSAANVIADDPPDLVLLDVQMPDMDGSEVYWRLEGGAERRLLPVVRPMPHSSRSLTPGRWGRHMPWMLTVDRCTGRLVRPLHVQSARATRLEGPELQLLRMAGREP